MKKIDFVKKVSEKSGLTQKAVREALDAMELVIGEMYQEDDELIMFGVKFEMRELKADSGKLETRDGEVREWSKPARKVPTVKILKSTKEKYSKEA